MDRGAPRCVCMHEYLQGSPVISAPCRGRLTTLRSKKPNRTQRGTTDRGAQKWSRDQIRSQPTLLHQLSDHPFGRDREICNAPTICELEFGIISMYLIVLRRPSNGVTLMLSVTCRTTSLYKS